MSQSSSSTILQSQLRLRDVSDLNLLGGVILFAVLNDLIQTLRAQALQQASNSVQEKLRGASHGEDGLVLNEDHQVSLISTEF